MRRFLRENGLSLIFALIFFLALVGEAVAGHASFNNQIRSEGLPPVSYGRYITSSAFAVDVAENWQSEYLQFFLYIVVTVWFVQRGSPESKQPDQAGLQSDERQRVGVHAGEDSPRAARTGGWLTLVYSHSLGAIMAAIFVLSWFAEWVAGVSAYNEVQLRQLQKPLSWWSYLGSADFWDRTLQNWQSEFLSIASMAILATYLRERGSPESKAVGAPHTSTGIGPED